MSQMLTALAAVKLVKGAGIIDLDTSEYEFLTGERLWLAPERSRARRCVEAAVYGALDYLALPRFAPPAEYVAAAIAVYVSPINVMFACQIMEGFEYSDNVINGIERAVTATHLMSLVIQLQAGNKGVMSSADDQVSVLLKDLQ